VGSAAWNHFDSNFGSGGKVFTDVGPQSDYVSAVAIQTDGKIVVAGNSSLGNYRFCAARYNTDGSLDMSFGFEGRTITPFDIWNDSANDIAIQPDGKIIVVGTTNTGNSDFDVAVVRYNSNGTLDTSFDGDGKKVIQVQTHDYGYSVAVQPDGKILIGGTSSTTNVDSDFMVLRLNPNGSLDNSFDADGKVVTIIGTSQDYGRKLILLPDGKIFVAGYIHINANDYELAAARYNSDGSLDATFSGDGKMISEFGASYESFEDALVQPDGKILILGSRLSGAPGFNYKVLVARYNSDGTIDTSFASGGSTLISASSTNDFGNGLVLQPDGKIVIGGIASKGLNVYDVFLTRLYSDGSPDRGFGAGSQIIKALGSQNNGLTDIALQADGKIVAVGYRETSGIADFAVTRFLPETSDFDFEGDGKSDISIFRPSVGEWWYQKSSNGGNAAFQFGNSNDKIVPADFTGDGRTDLAIWRPSTGEWFVLRSEDGSYYSFPFGTTGDIPAPADFDGDERADATVFRPSTGTWYILRASGETLIQGFGQNGDIPVVADYDADGKADICIYRPPVGEWWINRSAAGLIVHQFGNSTDKPVQGDYTGDGKADVAIWRPASGEWFILRSEDSSYYSYPFGTNGDVPAPGDFDGDGRADTTIFRPNGSTWYVQRSTAGTLIQNFGQNGDRPVQNAFVP
jgi:uncharacterized delta-60 repeat protein